LRHYHFNRRPNPNTLQPADQTKSDSSCPNASPVFVHPISLKQSHAKSNRTYLSKATKVSSVVFIAKRARSKLMRKVLAQPPSSESVDQSDLDCAKRDWRTRRSDERRPAHDLYVLTIMHSQRI
jgi:hypothetical protein